MKVWVPEMTLPMDKNASARPMDGSGTEIADLARGANGLGETDETVSRAAVPMARLVMAGFWSMGALSLTGMSVAATTAARMWSLGAGRRDGEDD